MKIGVLGGTFNPIHNGHILIGEAAYNDYGLDEIWLLPSGEPPHKRIFHNDNTYLQHRIEMVKLAIGDTPYFKLKMYEAKAHKKSYTFETMKALKGYYPKYDFYFIIGADSLFSFEKWKQFEEIFPNCTILVAVRNDKGYDEITDQAKYLTSKYNAKIEILMAPFLDISSTEVRSRIKANLPIDSMVHQDVAKYIRDNALYMD